MRRRDRCDAGIHECTMAAPPDPAVKCLASGGDEDLFYLYPHGAYLYWAPNSTTKHWLHYGDQTQSYFQSRDAQGVLWDSSRCSSPAHRLRAVQERRDLRVGAGTPPAPTRGETHGAHASR